MHEAWLVYNRFIMATLAHNTRPCRVGAVPILLAHGARLLRVVALLTVLLGTAGESAYGRAAAAPDARFIASAPLVVWRCSPVLDCS